jgi:hypothetical protein
MLYFSLPLDDYGIDNYSMNTQVGNTSILVSFSWPTEIQRIYDDQISHLDTMFLSIPLITVNDQESMYHNKFSFILIDSWKEFVKNPTSFDLSSTQWPYALRSALAALISDPTNTDLYTAIKALLDAIEPLLDYIRVIDEMLIWTITTEQDGDVRTICINPNTWLYQGYNDYRLYFRTLRDRIGRNDFGEVEMFIAIGEGDI